MEFRRFAAVALSGSSGYFFFGLAGTLAYRTGLVTSFFWYRFLLSSAGGRLGSFFFSVNWHEGDSVGFPHGELVGRETIHR